MIRALMPLADGVEEMEAVIVIDTLRRAGWEVQAAAVADITITASRGVRLLADTTWEEINPYSFDILVIPGGNGGTQALMTDIRIIDAVRRFVAADKIVAAICAGPLVLQAAGVLDGRRATCHPTARSEISSATLLDDRVVTDGRLLTSQGPGTAIEFALALISMADSSAKAAEIALGMVVRT